MRLTIAAVCAFFAMVNSCSANKKVRDLETQIAQPSTTPEQR